MLVWFVSDVSQNSQGLLRLETCRLDIELSIAAKVTYCPCRKCERTEASEAQQVAVWQIIQILQFLSQSSDDWRKMIEPYRNLCLPPDQQERDANGSVKIWRGEVLTIISMFEAVVSNGLVSSLRSAK